MSGLIAYNRPTDNLAGTQAWTAVGSQDTSYPATYLYDYSDLNIGFPSKLTIKSAGGWYTDFLVNTRVDLMVAWHNMDAAQTIKFEQHSAVLSNPATAADVSTTLTAPAKREDNFTVKLWKDMRTVTGYSASGKRYFRYYFPVPGANNSQFWGLKIWMGAQIRELPGFLQGGRDTNTRRVMRNRTGFGHQWNYNMEDAPRVWSGTLLLSQNSNDSTRLLSDLISLFRSGASYIPFFFVPDNTVNDGAFVRIQNLTDGDGMSLDQLDFTYVSQSVNQVNLSLVEVGIGGPEWT